MHLITQGPKLKKTLSGLIRRHDNIAFAVAWATSAADVFNLIHRFRRKIRCGVIGTHFYQTHPNVLTEFIDFGQVRFVFQPQGVFHPKAYLFWTGSKWDLLIGSANLTLGAHSTNSEMMVWVTSDDVESYDLKEKILRTINTYWQNGEVASRAKAREGLINKR